MPKIKQFHCSRCKKHKDHKIVVVGEEYLTYQCLTCGKTQTINIKENR